MCIQRVVPLVLLITAIWFPVVTEARDTFCTGPLTGTLDNLVVPSGASCTLSGALVRGDVRLDQGAALAITSPGSSLITGSIHADHCESVLLTGSVEVRGNLEIRHCAGTSGFTGPGIRISGDFGCEDNTGSCVADQGTVHGNLRVHNNSSPIAADISLTTIDGNLHCEHNSPLPSHLLGANQIRGKAVGQCKTALGFSVQTVPATTSQIGPEGGTLTTPQGDQLIVPAGALKATTAVSLRPVLRDEVAVALESNDFDGQKLNLVGALDIEDTEPFFSVPVKIAIPNANGLSSEAQILVAKISPDVTGDGIPDLILVDNAAVVGGQIQDGNAGLSGITTSGLYGLFQVVSSLPTGSTANGAPYSFVQGQVTNLTAPSAFVWNSAAPDFIVQTDSVGKFVTIVPPSSTTSTSNSVQNFAAVATPSSTSALFIAGDQFGRFGVASISLPGPISLPLKVTLPQACQLALSGPALCENSKEDAINQLKHQLDNRLENLFDPDPIQLSVTPTTIAQGGTATAVLDVQTFFADQVLKDFPMSLEPKVSLRNPYCPSLQMQAVAGLLKAQFSLATSMIASDYPSVASVSPALITSTSGGANPTATVLGVKASPTPANITGSLVGLSFTAQAELEITKPDGSQCPPVSATVAPELDAITVQSNPVPVTVQQPQNSVLVTFALGADDFGSLSIGGQTLCTYDNINAAGGCNGTVNMTPGVWYDIAIDYKNRAGSDGMSLAWDQPGPAIIGYGSVANALAPNLVPLANLRTSTSNGFVSGLTGQYFTLSGTPVSTAVGEGPIDAINNIYNNQAVGSWNGFGFFSLFEEQLTGQISLN